jgi:Flp pilus assembly protein TadG
MRALVGSPGHTASAVRCRAPQRGVVYVEALLTIGPLLLLLFGILQLVLLFSAQLVVQHAATRAVRSAVVVLEDDPARYAEEPRGQVVSEATPAPSGDRASPPQVGSTTALFSALESAPGQGSRLGVIRRAAYWPLSTLTPPLADVTFGAGSAVESQGGLITRFLGGALGLSGALTAVTLRTGPGSEDIVESDIAPLGLVTVHVAYIYRCTIPIASAMLCHSGRLLANATHAFQRAFDDFESASRGDLGRLRSHKPDPQFEHFAQQTQYVESPGTRDLMLIGGGYYRLIEAEATLPNQGACYYPGSACYEGTK